ncbi:TPA: hypothetical protein HA344_06685 [Candidatus Bathyarchaeota archaeon]|nr:hypothetical protein [Candidatus Bathyarchaeota archaeon]
MGVAGGGGVVAELVLAPRPVYAGGCPVGVEGVCLDVLQASVVDPVYIPEPAVVPLALRNHGVGEDVDALIL